MISTRNLKRAVFRSNKFYPLEKLNTILDSLKPHIEILSDQTGLTKNLTRIDGKLPAPLLVRPESVSLSGGSQIGCAINLKTATPETLLPFIKLYKPIVAASGARLLFFRSYQGANGQLAVETRLHWKEDQVSLELEFSSRHEPGHMDAEAVRGVFAFFEKLAGEPGKLADAWQAILATDQPKAAFRETFTLPAERFEDLVAALLGKNGPAGLKPDCCRLTAYDSEAWDTAAFNRGVELVNAHASLFKDATINYFWHLKRHDDYPLLADLYLTIDDNDLDTCLYEFKLPGGAIGILLLTYGKKGYRLFVSFDDKTPIDEFEDLTKIKFSLF